MSSANTLTNDQAWSTFLADAKHHYLNNSQYLIGEQMRDDIFLALFLATDRKNTLVNLKAVLNPDSYKKFLNLYRVYKSRSNASTTLLSISKYNFDNLNALTNQLGYQSNNETIELLWSYYVENHG